MIDLWRYKRFFAFGCSFTQYYWPTWADVIAKGMPQAEFYNFGLSGLGNMAISSRVSEAGCRFRFNQDDLVMVMWSTMCREDRWVRGSWRMTGNIFTQTDYGDDFVDKHVDTVGYLIRDLSLINLTTSYLKNTDAAFLFMPSVPFDHQQVSKNQPVSDIIGLYKDVIDSMPRSMYELEMCGNWGPGHSYHHPIMGVYNDNHPTPLNYAGYLDKIGINIGKDVYEYATDAEHRLRSLKTEKDLCVEFDYHGRVAKMNNLMF